MGLLDDFAGFIKTPEGQGLLSGVAGWAAGARKGTPWNNVGRGGLAGIMGYGNALEQQLQGQQAAQKSQLTNMQIDQLKKGLATKELLGKALMGGAVQQVQSQPFDTVSMPYGGGYSPSVSEAFGLPSGMPSVMPTQSNASPVPTMPSYADRLMEAAKQAGDVDAFQEAIKLKMEERKLAPKFATDVRVVMQNGKPTVVQMADDGTWRPMGEGITPAEKLHFADNGQRAGIGIDQYTGLPVTKGIQKQQSPESVASNALGWANHNFTVSQAGKPQFNAEAGGWVTPPSGMKPGEVSKVEGLSPKMSEDQGKATGWLAQATNAYSNIKGVLDKNASAAYPGFNDALSSIPSFGLTSAIANKMRSEDRQKFLQASSSLSEALLRAATGAGITKDEAEQKVKELTPAFGDGDAIVKQKMDAIPVYIESLKVRAGPGAQKIPGIFTAADSVRQSSSGAIDFKAAAAAELKRRGK